MATEAYTHNERGDISFYLVWKDFGLYFIFGTRGSYDGEEEVGQGASAFIVVKVQEMMMGQQF